MNWYDTHIWEAAYCLVSSFRMKKQTKKINCLQTCIHYFEFSHSLRHPSLKQFWKCQGRAKLRRKTSKGGKTEAKDSAAPCFLITITISSFKGLTPPLLHIPFPFKKFQAKLSIETNCINQSSKCHLVPNGMFHQSSSQVDLKWSSAF